MKNGRWKMENEKWKMENGRWKIKIRKSYSSFPFFIFHFLFFINQLTSGTPDERTDHGEDGHGP
jgi:hypothetical protein